jgi:hypothetical protein
MRGKPRLAFYLFSYWKLTGTGKRRYNMPKDVCPMKFLTAFAFCSPKMYEEGGIMNE